MFHHSVEEIEAQDHIPRGLGPQTEVSSFWVQWIFLPYILDCLQEVCDATNF